MRGSFVYVSDGKGKNMAKRKEDELDDETLALLAWCMEVETHLVAAGATPEQAQDHIEEQAEWYTDMFYDGLSPAEAAKQALA